eukprot:8043616-Alexandrium_andersonii.AAC.1
MLPATQASSLLRDPGMPPRSPGGEWFLTLVASLTAARTQLAGQSRMGSGPQARPSPGTSGRPVAAVEKG